VSARAHFARGADVTAAQTARIAGYRVPTMPHITTVEQYLASLPTDRRTALAQVRDTINRHLPAGYQETYQYNLISWVVPPSRLAATYNGQPLAFACLGSQKRHMALYLMCVYGSGELGTWFRDAYRATGKKLDMGKSCIRFTSLDALALDVVGQAISRVPVDAYVATYEASRSQKVTQKPVAKGANKPVKGANKPVKGAKKPVKAAKKPVKGAKKPAAKRR
jgi:hypothetical protein